MVKEIPLTQDKIAMVDDEDFERLNAFKWYYNQGKAKRALTVCSRTDCRSTQKRQIMLQMHRVIMNAPLGQEIDHKDGNGLNNQRSNLRFATDAENARNSRAKEGCLSRFRGVDLCIRNTRRKWIARIMTDGKSRYLGGHKTEEGAAMAYNRAALKYHGDFARVNEIP